MALNEALKAFTSEQEIQVEIIKSRKELESLSNEQLILRALASLIAHAMSEEIFYRVMVTVLKERSEK